MKFHWSLLAAFAVLAVVILSGCGLRFFAARQGEVICLPVCVDAADKDNFWWW